MNAQILELEYRNPTQIMGITRDDIQAILEKTLREFKESKTRILHLDCTYLYNFHLDDFRYIRTINLLMRELPEAMLLMNRWHGVLERWFQDQTVTIGGRQIKPIKISRKFDKVPNEGMEMLAKCIIGLENTQPFKFHEIGKGEGAAFPSDEDLIDAVDRIDVTLGADGGSVQRDGSTIYWVGNHNKGVETHNTSETGIFNSNSPLTDEMMNHTVYSSPADYIPHIVNVDSPGTTTLLFQCSA